MNDVKLDAIRARLAEWMPNGWIYRARADWMPDAIRALLDQHAADQDRIKAAIALYDERESVFIAKIEKRDQHIKELEAANSAIAKEFRDLIFSEGYSCPMCGGAFRPGSPHEDDCLIAESD